MAHGPWLARASFGRGSDPSSHEQLGGADVGLPAARVERPQLQVSERSGSGFAVSQPHGCLCAQWVCGWQGLQLSAPRFARERR